jgi:hypothetical protein
MKRRLLSTLVPALIVMSILASCGPPEAGYSLLTISNKKGVPIDSISVTGGSMDSEPLKTSTGAAVRVPAGEVGEFVMEFVVDGMYSFTAKFQGGDTEEIEEDVGVFGKTILVFGETSTPVEKATLNLTNSTGEKIFELVLYDSQEDPTGVDYADFKYDGEYSRFEVLGLDDGASKEYEFGNADGTYYVYTSADLDTWTYQGSVDLTVNESADFTASN